MFRNIQRSGEKKKKHKKIKTKKQKKKTHKKIKTKKQKKKNSKEWFVNTKPGYGRFRCAYEIKWQNSSYIRSIERKVLNPLSTNCYNM